MEMLEMIGVMVVTMVNPLPLMIMTMTTIISTVPKDLKVSFCAAYYHVSEYKKFTNISVCLQKIVYKAYLHAY